MSQPDAERSVGTWLLAAQFVLRVNADPHAGVTIRQYWFLREIETRLHAFSRVANDNTSIPNLGQFILLRTLFRPTDTSSPTSAPRTLGTSRTRGQIPPSTR